MRLNEFTNDDLSEGVAGPKNCWLGHRKVGTQPGTGKNKGKRVNDCEKIKKEGVAEAKADPTGSWVVYDGSKVKKFKTHEGAKAYAEKNGGTVASSEYYHDKIQKKGVAEDQQENVNENELSRLRKLSGISIIKEEIEQQFNLIEEMVEALAEQHGVDAEQIWEDFESVDDYELLRESAAWQTSKGKSKSGGLNAKGVASYRRENPGSKLQMAVTTKPSKLKKGSKAAKRRKSFCARMSGVNGPMKKPNGKPTRKALALRKWNC